MGRTMVQNLADTSVNSLRHDWLHVYTMYIYCEIPTICQTSSTFLVGNKRKCIKMGYLKRDRYPEPQSERSVQSVRNHQEHGGRP